MGLKTMALVAAADIAVSGGTALAFAENGVTIPNGLQLIVPSDSNYQTRRNVTVKYRPPTLNARTGVSGKDKKSVCLAQPIVLADGSVVFNTLRIEREVHPSLSASDATELNKLGAQMLVDSDIANFWAYGSLT